VLPAARSRAAWLGAITGCTYLAWHKYNVAQFFKQARQTAKQSNVSEANFKPSNGIASNTSEASIEREASNGADSNIREANIKRFASNGIALKLFKHSIKVRNSVLAVMLVITLAAGTLALYHYKKDSADGRILIWKVTSNIIKDYPLLGIGQDMFKAHYMDYQAGYFRNHTNSKYETVADDNQYAFNEPLNVWAENGLVGLLLASGFVLSIFLPFTNKNFRFHPDASGSNLASPISTLFRFKLRSCLQKQKSGTWNLKPETRSEAKSRLAGWNLKPETCNLNCSKAEIGGAKPETILQSSLLSVLVFGCFAYPSEILPIKILAITCLGLLANCFALNTSTILNSEASNTREASNERERSELQTRSFKPLERQSHQTFFKLSITVTTLVLVYLLYPKGRELETTYKTWKDALDLYQYGLYEECIDDYEKAYPVLKNNGEFLINYGKALSIAEKHEEAVKILEQAKAYQSNTVLYTALGDSHKAIEDYKTAEHCYWWASIMIPYKIYPHYLLVRLYIDQENYNKAKKEAKRTLLMDVKVESKAVEEIKFELRKVINYKM
jgi:hypothetical protein